MNGTVRVAVAWYLPEYLRAHGIELRDVLQAVNVREDAFAHPDNTISYLEFERIVIESERRSGLDDVGLEIGRRTHLRDFGIAGEAALYAPTVGAALHRFTDFFNLHSTATVVSLLTNGDIARLVWAISNLGHRDTRHFQGGAAVIAVNILSDLCGANWHPLGVDIACRTPTSHKAFERYFGCRTRFDASETAVHFERRWLDAALPAADPARRQAVEAEAQAQLDAMQRDFPGLVRRLVRKEMLLGSFSMEEVAALLGIHRRTLDRRLQEHGVQYGELVEETKHEVARQLLRETDLSVQRIAEALHYSSAANFATAFRRVAGVPPSVYRRQATTQ
ncbi:MAG TPA: AraC family transcriptional regulator [Steroidobacteraceae bacterium]|nr:AraC family transcriptional regulator [Steroidobacteraceae bacterium]